jgi:hypothetical protein
VVPAAGVGVAPGAGARVIALAAVVGVLDAAVLGATECGRGVSLSDEPTSRAAGAPVGEPSPEAGDPVGSALTASRVWMVAAAD